MDSMTILRGAIIAYCFVYCFADTNIVGSTRVLLDGDIISCRTGERNLGNLNMDEIIDYNAGVCDAEEEWTDGAIAMHNSGSMNASIAKWPKKEISMCDVFAVPLFNKKIVKVELSENIGKYKIEKTRQKSILPNSSQKLFDGIISLVLPPILALFLVI